MNRKLEAHMIPPIRALMRDEMGLDVIVEEFSAGYGTADLVGAEICQENCRSREHMGIAEPLDQRHFVAVLYSLSGARHRTLAHLADQTALAESTLRSKVLPPMKRHGLIVRDPGGQIRLAKRPPSPTGNIVAVEAKQTRWREAILQARRYTFFADRTYVALWDGASRLVDRSLLHRRRLGLLAVEGDHAEVIVEAPQRTPRSAAMNRYCSESLYRSSLELVRQR